MNGFFGAGSKSGHADSRWPPEGGIDSTAAFGSESPWAASAWRETNGCRELHDAGAEALADRMVETCAMWVFMGSMACAIVSLGFLVLPMVATT